MKKYKNILILAGGDSTRFWPLKNKNLWKFLGKSLIQHLLEKKPSQLNLAQYANQITIVTNKNNQDQIQHIANLTLHESRIKVISQKENLTGQAGAILSAKNLIKGEVLILNANDIFDLIYLDYMHAYIIDKKPAALLLAQQVNKYFPGGYLKLEQEKISEIIEKPKPGKEPSNLVRLVVDYFSDFEALVKILENTNSSRDDLYEKAINQYIKETKKVGYLVYDAQHHWFSLKYPWHVIPFTNYFLSSLNKDVVLGKKVKIAKTAKIVGPCFIGDDTVIGDFTLVRQSHIGKNCQIGGYSEVTRSYLSDGICLHRNYVGDSVLDSNVQMGAGASTANFRFDAKSVKSLIGKDKIDTGLSKLGAIIGKNSKIGVNATLLPGVKIGKNTFIGPGETVYEDVEDNKFILNGNKQDNKLGIRY
ncbi:NTP transferase domain-containing protein [Candidatus Roizmanbacteria bacterium]|nr:NTP transferase domain-containing protein [Candidatus Roizmanbacteria bacterium]